jgi:hypothetical protein
MDLLRALTHPFESEVAVWTGPMGLAIIESATVVAYSDPEFLCIEGKIDVDVFCAGVADGVGYCFLRDSEEFVFYVRC